MNDQYVFTHNDVIESSFAEFSTSALLAVLLEIESKHPGILTYTVRLMALVADGWRLTSTASDPDASLKTQKELHKILTDITEHIRKEAERKNGGNHVPR